MINECALKNLLRVCSIRHRSMDNNKWTHCCLRWANRKLSGGETVSQTRIQHLNYVHCVYLCESAICLHMRVSIQQILRPNGKRPGRSHTIRPQHDYGWRLSGFRGKCCRDCSIARQFIGVCIKVMVVERKTICLEFIHRRYGILVVHTNDVDR